jgi:hypothetical protein
MVGPIQVRKRPKGCLTVLQQVVRQPQRPLDQQLLHRQAFLSNHRPLRQAHHQQIYSVEVQVETMRSATRTMTSQLPTLSMELGSQVRWGILNLQHPAVTSSMETRRNNHFLHSPGVSQVTFRKARLQAPRQVQKLRNHFSVVSASALRTLNHRRCRQANLRNHYLAHLA